MKRLLFSALFGAWTVAAAAQSDARIFRAEYVPYETRQLAEAGGTAQSAHVIPFYPEPFMIEGEIVSVGALVELPYRWTDGCVYLHLENVGQAAAVKINNRRVAASEDGFTPMEIDITPYVKEGSNSIIVDTRFSRVSQLEEGTPKLPRPLFENSYLYMQDKRSIVDYEARLVPDSTQKFGLLELNVAVRNAYNYPETVTVGYDIYAPDGKLLHFDFKELEVEGRSVDTLRIAQPVYGVYNYPWGNGKAHLYKVMLYTRRNGQLKEYIPLRLGFGRTELVDGKLYRLGKEIRMNRVDYNAAADRATTKRELMALIGRGHNTFCPSYPQPAWFYDLCDELGVYVIDTPAINATAKSDDRTVGGTPSNDPALCADYLERVKAMYSRMRNHTCIVAYTTGRHSGNGYNMYKAYEWLKAADPDRAVIYEDADGEWNSDL